MTTTKKQDYQLSYAKVNFDTFLELDPNLFNKEKKIYFIPESGFNYILENVIKNEETNSYVNIYKYLELTDKLLNANDKQIDSNKLQKIDKNYTEKVDELKGTVYTNKTGFIVPNKEKKILGSRYIYNLINSNKWVFIILDEIKEYKETIIENDLELNNPCNNDNYIYTLCNAKINTSAAIMAEYKYIFEKDNTYDKNIKKIENLSPQKKNSLLSNRILLILNFNKKRFIKKGENVNRVYSSFTSLSKIARIFLTINGKSFYVTDMTNAQPLLLAIYMINNNLELDQKYIDDVNNGIIYDNLIKKAEELNIIKEEIYNVKQNEIETFYFTERGDVKTLLFRSILFSVKTKKSNMVKVFSELYPVTYNTLKNSNLINAVLLQNFEADIILNLIPNCYYYTIQDAIACVDRNESDILVSKLKNKLNEVSNGKIQGKISFEESIPKFSEKINVNTNIIETINITSIRKRKTETKPRAIKTHKLENYNKFKELYDIMPKKTIMRMLKIKSENTFIAYKKQYLKEKENN